MNSTGDVGLLSSAGISGTPPTFSPAQLLPPNAKTMIISQNTNSNNDTQNALGEASNVKWTKINDVTTSQSIQPRPRHGHRAVAYGNYMIVFGGGNEGIVEELHVFETTTHEWFQPQMKGEIPPGCAAYGLVLDGCRMLLYGGMIEYGRYSSDLYELNISKWEWKKLKPKGPRNGETPCARLGHSFTIIRDQVFLFGGLANDSDDLKNNIPRYLNDMYTLQVRLNNDNGIWEIPVTFGSPPGPRESHTAVAYVSKDNRFNKLIIYGGMSGCRLGDLYILDVDTLMWCKPEVSGATPSPRSLHTATLVGEKMYVFGGWVPMLVEELKNSEKEWKCTNSLACLNVETLTWENLHQDILDDKVPRARAGHSAVVINTRIYVWSGRDGYRKAWNNQVCCKDLWQLEVQKPGDPGKVQLLRAGTNWLEVGWNPVPGADSYILQCVAYDVPSDPIFQSESNAAQPPLQSLAAAGYAPTPPIMTPVPISKPAKSAVPPIIKQEPVPATTSIAAASAAPPPTQVLSSLGNLPVSHPQPIVTPAVTSSTILVSLPNAVSQSSLPITSLAIPATATMQQQASEIPSTSVITLSMPSLAPTATSVATEAGTAVTVVSATSISPAVLPSASSLYTLPANVAGTVSSLFASKTIPRPVMTSVTTSPAATRGLLRFRTPVQVTQPRTPGTVVTSIPTGVTVMKSPSAGGILSTSTSEAASAQMSGMHTLAAAAAATQKIQTPPQTVKVVQQTPGQPQVYSQVKVANVSGVLPTTVRLSSPVTTTGKPGAAATAAATAGNVKQIIVQKPGAPGSGNQIYTVVKTSQGMALANLQGSKVIQGKPGLTPTSVVPASSIQGSPQKTANIIKWVAAPGGGVATASKPNIIATNQPIIGLAGQGTSASPRPTYIISKPATTMANRPQTPQYVVVTQASAIRSIQGMATNSLTGNQTITLPTSASAGGQPQGVKMIVMPSASGAATAGQSVKIITPGGMQTANAPKTVTLATSKPAQYITSSGQIVTIPPGLLQSGGQQQISIGGKQVTLQMAGGQKLAILSNSGGQFVQTSQSPGDIGKPKFVMVGTGQKTTLPASNPMRCTVSVGGVLQPDSTTNIGDGIAGQVAEGMVEMASGGGGDLSDQQNLNGVNADGDQGGLKGGNMYGPWSTFGFSGLPWMKLKGGGNEDFEYLRKHHGDSTIPIYSASTKFSWRDNLHFGLKGGAEGGDGESGSGQPTQETTGGATSDEVQQPVSQTSEAEPLQESASSTADTVPGEPSSSTDALLSIPTSEQSGEVPCVPTSSSEIPTPAQEADSNKTNVEAQPAATNAVPATEASNSSFLPQESSQLEGLQQTPTSSTEEQMDVSEPVSASETSSSVPSAVPVAMTPTETPMDTSAAPTEQPVLPPQISTAQLNPVQPNQQPSIQLVTNTQQPSLQLPVTQPPSTLPQPIIIHQQQPSMQQPVQPVLQLPVTQPQPVVSQLQSQQAAPQLVTVPAPQQSAPAPPQTVVLSTPTPVATIPPPPPIVIPPPPTVTSTNVIPPSVVNLPAGMFPIGTQPSIIMQPSPVSVQSSSPNISSLPVGVSISNPLILPSGLPVSIAASGALTVQQPVSGLAGAETSQPIVARLAVPNASVIRAQVTDTRLSNTNPAASLPSPSTNGAIPSQPTPVQVRLPVPPPEEKIDNWMDVIHTKNTSTIVKCYFTTNEKLSRLEPDIPVDKDLEFIKKKVELKPATAYKFRVAAINSCGRGPWGEVTAFKTCLPGFPGAPSSIKISKSVDGATIAWEPPLNTPGDILEYSVYLAVKPPPNAPEPKPGVTNLSFVRVYCGPSNQCNVPTASLNQALVDTTSKPAIIFRIAAKNDKGYGPATQVRWLQESAAPNFSTPKTGILKRAAPFAPTVVAKRGRADGN